MLSGFRPVLDTFPKLLKQGLTKREIAERASDHANLRLVQEAYRVKPAFMGSVSAVYFVSPDDQDVCKIGIAANPFDRLGGVQTGCWVKLHIRALFWYPTFNEAASHEYHALKFAKKNKLRLMGEWVNLPYQEAIGLALSEPEAESRRFTDSHGLLNDWYAETERQKLEAEDALYSRRPKKAA